MDRICIDYVSSIIQSMDRTFDSSNLSTNNQQPVMQCEQLSKDDQKTSVMRSGDDAVSTQRPILPKNVSKCKKFGLSRKFPLMEKSQKVMKIIQHSRQVVKPRAHLAKFENSPVDSIPADKRNIETLSKNVSNLTKQNESSKNTSLYSSKKLKQKTKSVLCTFKKVVPTPVTNKDSSSEDEYENFLKKNKREKCKPIVGTKKEMQYKKVMKLTKKQNTVNSEKCTNKQEISKISLKASKRIKSRCDKSYSQDSGHSVSSVPKRYSTKNEHAKFLHKTIDKKIAAKSVASQITGRSVDKDRPSKWLSHKLYKQRTDNNKSESDGDIYNDSVIPDSPSESNRAGDDSSSEINEVYYLLNNHKSETLTTKRKFEKESTKSSKMAKTNSTKPHISEHNFNYDGSTSHLYYRRSKAKVCCKNEGPETVINNHNFSNTEADNEAILRTSCDTQIVSQVKPVVSEENSKLITNYKREIDGKSTMLVSDICDRQENDSIITMNKADFIPFDEFIRMSDSQKLLSANNCENVSSHDIVTIDLTVSDDEFESDTKALNTKSGLSSKAVVIDITISDEEFESDAKALKTKSGLSSTAKQPRTIHFEEIKTEVVKEERIIQNIGPLRSNYNDSLCPSHGEIQNISQDTQTGLAINNIQPTLGVIFDKGPSCSSQSVSVPINKKSCNKNGKFENCNIGVVKPAVNNNFLTEENRSPEENLKIQACANNGEHSTSSMNQQTNNLPSESAIQELLESIKKSLNNYVNVVNVRDCFVESLNLLEQEYASIILDQRSSLQNYLEELENNRGKESSPGICENLSASMINLQDTENWRKTGSSLELVSVVKEGMTFVPLSSIREEDILTTGEQQPGDAKCVVCGKDAAVACRQCTKVFFCSDECGKIYWEKGHSTQCEK